MASIEVERAGGDGRHRFLVRVAEGGSETRHDVTLSEEDYSRLGSGHGTPEAFIEACFGFLLAREPKEQILRSFDVSVISRYFPEFEREIAS